MELSISISLVINFDNKDDILNIINKFKSSEINCEIIIIDNGKNFRKYLANDDRLKYIFNNKHIGYANAHNLSIKHLNKVHKYHLFSNVDLDIDYSDENDVLKILYNFMEMNDECGIVGPKILDENGNLYNSCKLLPTPIDIFLGKISEKLRNIISNYSINIETISSKAHIPFISGCFLFCKRKALEEINFMDKNFFLFMDDVDLCRRMGEKYKIYYCNDAIIKHEHGRIHTQSLYLNFIAIKSIVYYFNKSGWFIDKVRKKLNNNIKFKIK